MHHPIDPKIDCVFKALLGAENNRDLLIHFLNAILGTALPRPIADVTILNPYNEREFLDDKLSIVDVKARDDQQRLYQVEIQLLVYRDLPARILYTWADLYGQQLQSGHAYSELRPTYAIWLLAESLLPHDPRAVHRYVLRDESGGVLIDHGGIWLLELSKFAAEQVETEQQRWLKFLKEGEQLDADNLPDWMQTDEMRQAMSTLKAFSEKERAYHAYQARQNFLRQQRSIQNELAEAMAATEAARSETQAARSETQAARSETQAARSETQAALRAKKAALQREQTERQAKEDALAEIERLKAKLQDQ